MTRDSRPELNTPWSGDLPSAFGLYDPANEHDACGVSFVVDIKGRATHEIVAMGIGALCNLEHRGAQGAEANTGDGAGITIQIPDRFLRAVVDFALPPAGQYAVGVAFLPTAEADTEQVVSHIEKIVGSEGLRVLGWREVPVDDSMIGDGARQVMPLFRQLFIGAAQGQQTDRMTLERLAFVVRKRVEHEVGKSVYFPSLSSRHVDLQGDAHRAAAVAVLHRHQRRTGGVGDRTRPLALQHEHVPFVAARASVPLHRAQR